MLSDRAQRLNRALEKAAHFLPAQGPIGVFIHHNTLHAFESLPFERAVVEAAEVFGAQPFASESEYRAAYARGRILERDLDAVLRRELGKRCDEHVVPTLSRLGFGKHALLARVDEPNERALAWQREEGQLFRGLARTLSARARASLLGSDVGSVEAALERLWDAAAARFSRENEPLAPRPRRLRDALLDRTGEDSDAFVHPTLIRLTAAFLDQGIAYWPMPNRGRGLFRAACQLLGQPAPPPNAWVRRLTLELRRLGAREISAVEFVLEVFDDMALADDDWELTIRSKLLALPGWAGIMHQLEERPDRAPARVVPARLLDFLALRLALEREAFRFIAPRHGLAVTTLAELRRALDALPLAPPNENGMSTIHAAFRVLAHAGIGAREVESWDAETCERFVAELHAFAPVERRRIWHLAYERRHAHEILDPLARHLESAPAHEAERMPRFQGVFCFDERLESVRRHLEEVLPEVETWGTAGFFGVAMYYQGVDDAHPQPLCPIAIAPRHEVHELAAPGKSAALERRKRSRKLAGRLAVSADVGSRTFVRGTIWSAALGLVSAVPLVFRVLFPRATSELGRGFGELSLPSVETRLAIERHGDERSATARLLGFSIEEMTDIVQRVLEDMGLTRRFARLVVVAGHGSSSLNNPHESAHDCGACGGGRGGPNARAFAQMANHWRVREALHARGIDIPETTSFIGCLYDTCNDSITFYDEEMLPSALHDELETFRDALDVARARDAHERSRRFESARLELGPEQALRHVEARAVDLAQPRPEYGHATNAVALIGRRQRTRGLFLDRRAFLISYDAGQDPDAKILARLLAAAVPVGAGINLEYYFSYVDPVRYGSGTKLPHNITSLIGVMDGYSSDLRTGLPWQMVEIHEPVRMLTVIEAMPRAVLEALGALPAVKQFVDNDWIRLIALEPDSPRLHAYRAGSFSPWISEATELSEVTSSAAWYRGHREHLGIARIQGREVSAG